MASQAPNKRGPLIPVILKTMLLPPPAAEDFAMYAL